MTVVSKVSRENVEYISKVTYWRTRSPVTALRAKVLIGFTRLAAGLPAS